MLELSNLNKTWILDVDGTLVKHNGYLIDGYDTLLDGVKEFFEQISPEDKVVLMTARKSEYIEDLKRFLKSNGIRYDYILSDIPTGERILVNDNKPSGLEMAYCCNKNRDSALDIEFKINPNL